MFEPYDALISDTEPVLPSIKDKSFSLTAMEIKKARDPIGVWVIDFLEALILKFIYNIHIYQYYVNYFFRERFDWHPCMSVTSRGMYWTLSDWHEDDSLSLIIATFLVY